ncbi:MAG: MFS transporter [Anaerolineales bacterium]|nr:MAG: MFS transporter [Anaerolineales bacterium]
MSDIAASPHLKRDVVALSLMTLCYAAFQGMCQTLVPLSMAHLALTKTTIGLMQAVPGVVIILLGAPFARMANGRWRRETLTFCFSLTLIASLLYSRASRPVDFIAQQLLFGLSSTAFWSNMLATSFRLGQGTRQGKIQTYITTMQGVGAFGGPLLSGYLSTRSYAYGFYAGVLCAVAGLIASRLISRSQAIEPRVGTREFFAGAYVRLFSVITRRPIVILGMGFVSMSCFLLYVMGGSFYLVYASQIGLSAFVAAALVSGRDAISAVLRMGFGTITRYISPVALLGVGIVLGAFSLSLLPMGTSLLSVGAVAVAQGIFLAFLPPAVNTLIGTSTAPEEQAFAITGMNTSNLVAQTTMSPLLGLLLNNYGYRTVYPVIGGVWICLALLVLRAGVQLMRRNAVPGQAIATSSAG